ncbi:glycosyltransferase family 4 [alpha proteobacterium HIMB5]|nr:glycosyltransferase family 4 [alpha proteobacterium HIMB5]
MTLEITKLGFIILASLFIFFVYSKINKLHKKSLDPHQMYSSDFLGSPIGGHIVFLFLLFFNFYLDYQELFFLFSIFLLGTLSDYKLFNSPKYRLLFQILIIITFVIFSKLNIESTRIQLVDQILENKFINIGFTAFCILIVINGSNFIDGLNGLTLGYYIILLLLLLNSNFDLINNFDKNILVNLFFLLVVLIIANFMGIVFLGDNGSYLLGFLFSIYLIKIHQINNDISPYFIILLLWYPCFEILFSIIRKFFLKVAAIDPDTDHLHQLIFLYFILKLKIKKKLLANNLSSLIINMYNFPIFLIGMMNYNNTNLQIILISINLTVYTIIYLILKKLKKNNLISFFKIQFN